MLRNSIYYSFILLIGFASSAVVWADSIDATCGKRGKSALEQLLHAQPYDQGYEYLVTAHEWHELCMSTYIELFDRSHTVFGRWGLEQLTKPITHKAIIQARQKGIAQFVDEQELSYALCYLLDELHRHEGAVLSYYDEHDELSQKAKRLYYNHFLSVLNKSQLALEYAYAVDVGSAATNLAALLCINGLAIEFIQAQLQGRSMRFMDGMKKGFTEIVTSHSPYDTDYQQLKADQKFLPAVPYVHKDAAVHGWSSVIKELGAQTKYYAGHWLTRLTSSASADMLIRGTFGDKWSYFSEQWSWPSSVAFFWVLGQIGYQDYAFYMKVSKNYKRLVFLYKTYLGLQHRLVMVATFCKQAERLIEQAQEIEALREHPAIKHAYRLFHDESTEVYELFTQLQAKTFQEKSAWLYSRGQVLITHQLLIDLNNELLPVMRAIGIIDGYVSICRVYQEHTQQNDKRFCFAEFIETEHPHYELEAGWLPLIKNASVRNSSTVHKGVGQHVILTGPNGAGKSSFLKLMGGSVILAQSWGIVPADRCIISFFDRLRTSFNPQEDIKRGISSFMAQQEQLHKVMQAVEQTKGHALVLIDEPYRGTIEAEAEKRSYDIAKQLAQHDGCMLVMATHLYKPVTLQKETGTFKNMHAEIEMHADGGFTRSFRIKDGIADWWFTDIDKRVQFVDWLYANHPSDCY